MTSNLRKPQTNQRAIVIFATTTALLSIPLIAMQFSNEVNWTGSDFVIAAVLLFGTSFTLEIILRRVRTAKAKFITAAILITILFLVWAELAVGLFGTPFAGS